MAVFVFLAFSAVLISGAFGQCPAPDHCTCTGKTVECKKVDNTVTFEEILTSLVTNNPDTETLSFIDGEITVFKKDQFQGLGNLRTLNVLNAKFVGNLGLNEEALNGLNKLLTLRIAMNNQGALGDTPIMFPINFFKPLTSLKTLRLDGNRLGASPSQGVFNGLETLDVLDLSSNGIQKPEAGGLSVLRGLKELNLGSNDIMNMSPEALSGLDWLESIVLSSNPAIELKDTSLTKLKALKSLDLSFNQLSDIDPQMLSSVKATLENLDLSSNNLATIKNNMFAGLGALKMLNLSSQPTGIKTFEPSAFVGLTSLMKLDLSRDSLSHLKPAAFENIPNAHLILDGNRFFCNCEMMPMREWILTSSKDTALVCSFPPSLMNKNLADIDPVKDIGCVKPKFAKLDEYVRGEEGTTVRFFCSVVNKLHYPEMSYTILSGSPLPANRSTVEVTNSSDASNYKTRALVFTVNDVTKADNGLIKCTGKGSAGSVTATIDIFYGYEGLPLWGIIVIVVIVVLVIVCVIVGIVLSRKRKYKAVRRH